MPRQLGMKPVMLALCVGIALAGCKSKEEKAEEYYTSAMALVAKGDVPRAMVELRNVFEYDGAHQAARREYADLLLASGRIQEAYSQYLRLSEQYPDLVAPHRILAELSLRSGNLEAARRQMDDTLELKPGDPGAQAIGLALRLHEALARGDTSAYGPIAQKARALVTNDPGIPTGWHVLIDALNAQDQKPQALDAIDAALAQNPVQYRLQVMRLNLLSALGKQDEIGAQLKVMQKLFPDDEKTRTALVAWYVLRDDPEGATRYLQSLSAEQNKDAQGYVELVQMLAEHQGPAAAARELDALIAQNPGTHEGRMFGAMRADLDFNAGRVAEAIARMKALLQDAPAGEQTDRLRVSYARMLDGAGQRKAAQSQLDAALASDPDLVPALRLHAKWLIEQDEPDAALVALRRALQQAPQDPESLSLMAQADLRQGAPDLAANRLSQAYEASNHGPMQARSYVDFLMEHDRKSAARALLADALQHNPDDPGLLHRQADLALAENDWVQAQRIANHLETLPQPEAHGLAQGIRAAILLGRGQSDAAIDTLKSLADTSRDTRAIAAVVQAQLAAGHPDAARSYLTQKLAATPQDRGLRLLSANLAALNGDTQTARDELRALWSEQPSQSAPARQLYRLLAASGDDAAAREVADKTLAAQGATPDPLLMLYKARSQEKAGDIDGAIATYEALYQRNSDNPVLANNLASLLAQHRDDTASLKRAESIAQRFRESPEPAFKDTYGWAEYRLGNYDSALPLLAAAAAGLPDNPVAQYHYALALEATGDLPGAAKALDHAIASAGNALPEGMTDAKARREALAAKTRGQ
ncbi:tetratricopeptide repeat protein [Thioclava sp. BHET1]|nr:tetratricopeptide repeat protein [Thioclava sp. BHET1]